jgi:hypothetical protein
MDVIRLRELLEYDPATGQFWWKHKRRRVNPGDLAGCLISQGYIHVSIDGVAYKAHRLAWLHCHGRWPTEEIDHVNGVRSDNRIVNLREASSAENHRNKKLQINNKCRLKGVRRKRGKFSACIWTDGKSVHIGTYGTQEAAHAAYWAKASELFGTFARAA